MIVGHGAEFKGLCEPSAACVRRGQKRCVCVCVCVCARVNNSLLPVSLHVKVHQNKCLDSDSVCVLVLGLFVSKHNEPIHPHAHRPRLSSAHTHIYGQTNNLKCGISPADPCPLKQANSEKVKR